MASRAVRERIAQDLGTWLTDGLIRPATHDLLRQRYAVRSFGIAQMAKYVGFSGALLVCFGLLGVVGAASGSRMVEGALLIAVGAAMGTWGIRLAIDPLARHVMSSKVLLTIGVAAAFLGIGLVVSGWFDDDATKVLVTGCIAIPAVLGLAYRYANIYLLILGLLGLMHWIGCWTAMVGRSTYEVDIVSPMWMSAAAVIVVAAGIGHEVYLRERFGRFFHAYEAVGLLYLDLSLLVLSLDAGWSSLPLLVWTGLLALAAIIQIVVGARLHNGLSTGFGVTAFAVNLFTVCYAHSWNVDYRGLLLLVGGASLIGIGIGCEAVLRRMHPRPS